MFNRINVRYGAMVLLVAVAAIGTIRLSGGEPPAEGSARGEDGAPPKGRVIDVLDCSINLVDEVTLACDRPGIVAFVKFRAGDSVQDGDLVAGLDDEVAQATLAIVAKEAESDVDIRYSEKSSQVALVEHKKALETNSRGKVIPQVEVERLKLAAEKTLLELESAKHRQAVNQLKRDEAQAQLNTYRIKAPFDGIVTRVHRSKGEAVRQGDQVLELVSTARVYVDGLVSVADIWQVKRGDAVDVQLDIKDLDLDVEKKSFQGRIVFVDVKAEPVTQRVRVRAEVDNPDNVLRAGLIARMRISSGSAASHPE